jgi:hypothetical protein
MQSITDVEAVLAKAQQGDDGFVPLAGGILADEKRRAVAQGDESLARHLWCLETVLGIQSTYQLAFTAIKRQHFYNAWCALERCEIDLANLEHHFSHEWDRFWMRFINDHVERWQSLFPYKLFVSPEIVELEKLCSICKRPITIRNTCGHMVGEIYGGELCFRIVSQAKAMAMAIVRTPVQKYSVGFPTDPKTGHRVDTYDYRLVRYASDRLESAFHGWEVTWTKRHHPHSRYRHVGRNDPCPCESGRKYKKCCLTAPGVVRPHVEFGFSVPPPGRDPSTVDYLD